MIKMLNVTHRQGFDQNNLPIKVKNKFVNFLFSNRQLESVTYNKTIICYGLLFLIFLALAIFFYVEVSSVKQLTKQYYTPQTTGCTISNTCVVNFTISDTMKQPIYLMYELGNFYQNVRRYIQSKNNFQLAGNSISLFEAQSCYPYITNADILASQSWGGSALNANDVASPCGAIAYTYFNDTFALSDSSGKSIPINETGISWNGDKGNKFQRSPNSSTTQWVDPENQHFIVWMRTSGLPNFRKPWGRIESDLQPGTYSMAVKNNYNSSSWDGNRLFVLTTMSIIGGKNYLLPTAFLCIGLFSLVAAIFFCFRFRALRDIGKIKL